MNYTVYTISDDLQGRIVYVGETSDFERRKYQHLSLNANTKEWIASIGVENVSITPIAEFSTEEEALRYEDDAILKYNTIEDGFNIRRSGLIATDDIAEYQKQYQQQYRKEHMTEIAERWKQYKQEHSAELAEYQKQYRQEHRGENAECWKQYQKQYQKQYRAKKKAEKQLQLDIASTPEGQFVQLTIPF